MMKDTFFLRDVRRVLVVAHVCVSLRRDFLSGLHFNGTLLSLAREGPAVFIQSSFEFRRDVA